MGARSVRVQEGLRGGGGGRAERESLRFESCGGTSEDGRGPGPRTTGSLGGGGARGRAGAARSCAGVRKNLKSWGPKPGPGGGSRPTQGWELSASGC